MSLATDITELQETAPVFAALGDNTRLRLLARLQDGEAHAVVDLTEGTGLSRQAISKHLAILHNAGLVRQQRVGRESRYRFHTKGIERARTYLETASAQWDTTIARLKMFTEQDSE
jgi:DNA-binding transcriptional ArsR family regulator